MKRIAILILILISSLAMTSCTSVLAIMYLKSQYDSSEHGSNSRVYFGDGVDATDDGESTKITLDGLTGKSIVRIPCPDNFEGHVYYSASITEGSITVYSDLGSPLDTEPLFELSSASGCMIGSKETDKDRAGITLVIDAENAAVGEILIGFIKLTDEG